MRATALTQSERRGQRQLRLRRRRAAGEGHRGGGETVYLGDYYEWTGSTSTAKRYYYAGGQRIAERVGDSTLYFLLGDHLGSTSITANSSGGLVAEVRYMPWGETRCASGTTPTTLRYTGQRQESGLGGANGLYDYGARWLDPYVGRWVQPDFIVPNTFNPQSLNRFSMVRNNPLKFTDPTGHQEAGPCGAYGEECSSGHLPNFPLPASVPQAPSSRQTTPTPDCLICRATETPSVPTPTRDWSLLLGPSPTPRTVIGPSGPGQRVETTRLDLSQLTVLDWLSLGVDVAGIAGDLAVGAGIISGAGVAPAGTAWGVTEALEAVDLAVVSADAIATGSLSGPSSFVADRVIQVKLGRLIPFVGMFFNAFDIANTLDKAVVTESRIIP